MDLKPQAVDPAVVAPPQPTTSSVPPEQAPQIIAPPQPTTTNVPPVQAVASIAQPQPTSIYPTPNSAYANPASASAINNSANYNSPFTPYASTNSYGLIALGLGGAAVAIIPLLIFVPSLLNSMSMVTVWLAVVTALATVGLFLGLKSQKNTQQVDTLGLLAIILATVMLVLCITMGSYYIKIQLTLNSFKSKYKSNTSTPYKYDL